MELLVGILFNFETIPQYFIHSKQNKNTNLPFQTEEMNFEKFNCLALLRRNLEIISSFFARNGTLKTLSLETTKKNAGTSKSQVLTSYKQRIFSLKAKPPLKL